MIGGVATHVLAALLVAGGLVPLYARLRDEFGRPVAALAVVLLAGATPAASAVLRGVVMDALAFCAVAALIWWYARRTASRASRHAAAAAALAVPVLLGIASGAERRPLDLVLFSPDGGLLSLTPIVYVALLGTVVRVRRDPAGTLLGAGSLLIWAAAGAPLGGAMATLAPGLAHVGAAARARPLLAVAPLVLAALAWNYWLMVQYTAGLLPKDEPVSFARLVRQQADVHTAAPYVYPFALPANAWFAWREGVPAARFDALAHVRPAPSFALVLDREADRFLLEGWDAPGMDGSRPVRWIGAPRATLVFPLQVTAGDVAVAITARARLDDPAVSALLSLEINGHEVGRFEAPPTEPTDARFVLPPSAVGRILRTGYNRLTIVSRGTHRSDPSDLREPGPLAVQRGTRAWPVAIYSVSIAPSQESSAAPAAAPRPRAPSS